MELLRALEKGTARLVGLITYGAGMNARTWIAEARAQGYHVRLTDGHAELYALKK